MREVRERCVWTQEMTHAALVPYLIEECHEVIEAVEAGSVVELREELGDLLWQVLFHAEIASRADEGAFTIDDVARDLADKMIRRHPHVFAGETARTPEEVLVHWNAAKAAEKRDRTSVLDGVPASMPALALAQKVLAKAEKVGVVAPDALDAPERVIDDERSFGDELLRMVATARARGWDAERALRAAVRRVGDDVRAREAAAGSD